MIKFKNEHGTFELEIGKRYDFTGFKDDNGNEFTIINSEMLGETGDVLDLRDSDDDLFYMEKENILRIKESI